MKLGRYEFNENKRLDGVGDILWNYCFELTLISFLMTRKNKIMKLALDFQLESLHSQMVHQIKC